MNTSNANIILSYVSLNLKYKYFQFIETLYCQVVRKNTQFFMSLFTISLGNRNMFV